MDLDDLEMQEGYSATFKVKIDFGYPKCRVLFYKNEILLLNDNKHEICNLNFIVINLFCFSGKILLEFLNFSRDLKRFFAYILLYLSIAKISIYFHLKY
jgi:hypothetical protein